MSLIREIESDSGIILHVTSELDIVPKIDNIGHEITDWPSFNNIKNYISSIDKFFKNNKIIYTTFTIKIDGSNLYFHVKEFNKKWFLMSINSRNTLLFTGPLDIKDIGIISIPAFGNNYNVNNIIINVVNFCIKLAITLGVSEIGVYGEIFKHSIIESFFPFGYIRFDNIMDRDIKLLNLHTHVLFSTIMELINIESNIVVPSVTSYEELSEYLKIQTTVVIMIPPILASGDLYHCMIILENSLMKPYETHNLFEGVFGVTEHFPNNLNIVVPGNNKNINIISGFKLKTLAYNLKKKQKEWDVDIDIYLGSPVYDIAYIIKNTFGVRQQKKISEKKYLVIDNIELNTTVDDDSYVVNFAIDEVIKKAEWFLNNLDIKPTEQLKSLSAFCKKKDFSNISPTSTNFINFVLFEIKRYCEENEMLDDVEEKKDYYKNLICDNFKLKSADIIKNLVKSEKK